MCMGMNNTEFRFDNNYNWEKKVFCKKPWHVHVGMKLKKHGNKVEIKTQIKTNLIQKDGGEERKEEYPTSVPHT